MVPSAVARHLQRMAHNALQRILDGDDAVVFPFLSLVTLTLAFELDIQAHPSEGPNTSSV